MASIRERAEILATRLVVSHLLAHIFRTDRAIAARFASDLQRSIDAFQFIDGWTPADEDLAREFMRSSADEILSPAINVASD